MELKREAHAAKNAFVARMMNDTQELRQSQQTLQAALTEVLELTGDLPYVSFEGTHRMVQYWCFVWTETLKLCAVCRQ